MLKQELRSFLGPSRGPPSVVVKDARSKRSSTSGERWLFCVLSTPFVRRWRGATCWQWPCFSRARWFVRSPALILSRNDDCLHPSVPRDHRRLSVAIVVSRGQQYAEHAQQCVARGGCPVCPVCSVRRRSVWSGLCVHRPCFPRARWFVRCRYSHVTLRSKRPVAFLSLVVSAAAALWYFLAHIMLAIFLCCRRLWLRIDYTSTRSDSFVSYQVLLMLFIFDPHSCSMYQMGINSFMHPFQTLAPS